jgi:hypothetical protein
MEGAQFGLLRGGQKGQVTGQVKEVRQFGERAEGDVQEPPELAAAAFRGSLRDIGGG